MTRRAASASASGSAAEATEADDGLTAVQKAAGTWPVPAGQLAARAARDKVSLATAAARLAMPKMAYGMFEMLGPDGTTVRVLDREVATTL